MEVISNNKTATNTVELEVKVGAEDFEKALQDAYLKRSKKDDRSQVRRDILL